VPYPAAVLEQAELQQNGVLVWQFGSHAPSLASDSSACRKQSWQTDCQVAVCCPTSHIVIRLSNCACSVCCRWLAVNASAAAGADSGAKWPWVAISREGIASASGCHAPYVSCQRIAATTCAGCMLHHARFNGHACTRFVRHESAVLQGFTVTCLAAPTTSITYLRPPCFFNFNSIDVLLRSLLYVRLAHALACSGLLLLLTGVFSACKGIRSNATTACR
jgi:hypothetical protein